MGNWPFIVIVLACYAFIVLEVCTACHGVNNGRCQLVDNNGNHLVCVNQTPAAFHFQAGARKNITNVTICAWPYRTFKVMWHLSFFPDLLHFTLTGSQVQRVDNFNEIKALQTINLTQLHLTSLEQDVFLGLTALQSVDLRQNYLSYLDALHIFNSTTSLNSLYLAGNNWTCDPRLIWLLEDCPSCLGSKVVDKQQLMCEGKNKAIPKHLLKVMKIIQVMQSQCPAPCTCWLEHAFIANTYLVDEKGKLVPNIIVNCSNLNMTSMPAHLPDYTTSLYLRHNNLTSVEELVYNRHYRDVKEVYLDNNQISAINILEGTYWLNNFNVFSLRNNRLKQIPLYALDHAFISQKLGHMYLGHNPWRCDCKFTIHFRDFIAKYRIIIADLQDIRCRKMEGDTNSNKKVIDLVRLDLCVDHEVTKLSFLDKLNIFLASMIFLVISLFLYNFTVYKTSGKLPWMVEKFF